MAKILVADDNSNIQKMVVLALKDQGIDVVAVGNGEAAVRKISDIRPDLVLADVFMPVRNGYEVCRYVKEDSKLSHIPVILLVGAFDPLDEQEAQRVAADGVLKKPFVPPDPLISMVKSALTRAGVSLGPAPTVEKPVPTETTRPITELFHAASSQAAAVPSEAIPEAAPEPVQEFELPKPPVKISEGQQPVAFGSLLDTSEEEAAAVTSKPMINLAADRKWDEQSDEVREEEEDEENSSGGWRATGLDEEMEKAAAPSAGGAKDWRDGALADTTDSHDHSASHWAPTPEDPEIVEAAEVPSVALSTIETSPAPTKTPFGGDDWAATMAAGIEEKLTEAKEAASTTAEVAPVAHDREAAPELAQETHVAPVSEETPAAEPTNWAVVPETSWEMEAKRASMLASTWDAPAAQDLEATQDVPVYARHAPEFFQEHAAEHTTESVSAYSGVPEVHGEEPKAAEIHTETASTLPLVEEPEQKPWETHLEPPGAEPAVFSGDSHTDVPTVEERLSQPATSEEPAVQTAQPDMDVLVARVLQKMNPDVLRKVTQEILKPVIEAIVRNELDSKK